MRRLSPTRPLFAGFLSLATACTAAKALPSDKTSQTKAAASPQRVVACKVMTVEELSALSGTTYSTFEAVDDPTQPESKCHYGSATNPAGASLDIDWITPSDYSSEAEHLALQHALIGGANLAGKLTEGMVPAGATGAMPSGAVEGVGDEATVGLGLLTVRKGDYRILVQIVPTDMMKFVTDPKVSTALVEAEKAVATKVISRLP